MNAQTCSREAEVLESILAGRWAGTESELHEHAASCAPCGELASVAAALQAEYQAALRDAHVPSSGVVWWRAQRREREEALLAATRTITVVQTASVIGAVAIALTILGGITAMSTNWHSWLMQYFDAMHFGAAPAYAWMMPVLAAGATLIALAPFAVYVAVAKD